MACRRSSRSHCPSRLRRWERPGECGSRMNASMSRSRKVLPRPLALSPPATDIVAPFCLSLEFFARPKSAIFTELKSAGSLRMRFSSCRLRREREDCAVRQQGRKGTRPGNLSPWRGEVRVSSEPQLHSRRVGRGMRCRDTFCVPPVERAERELNPKRGALRLGWRVAPRRTLRSLWAMSCACRYSIPFRTCRNR